MGVFKIAGLLPTDKFGKRTNWTSRGSRITFSVFTVHKYAKSKSALYSYVFPKQFSASVKFLAW
jgi:hypothetical protein